jgi:hypothetical protein
LQQLMLLQQQMQQLQCNSYGSLTPQSLTSSIESKPDSINGPLLSNIAPNRRLPFRPLTRAASSPMVASATLAAAAAVVAKSNQESNAAMPMHSSVVACSSSARNSPIASGPMAIANELNGPLWTGCSSPGPSANVCTALITELAMMKHSCACGDQLMHLEKPARMQAILSALQESGLASKCVRLRARKANFEELESVHGALYCQLFGCGPLARQKLSTTQIDELPIKSFVRLACGGVGVDSDTTWNDMFTPAAARFAAGCVIELALKVAKGKCLLLLLLFEGYPESNFTFFLLPLPANNRIDKRKC